MKAVTARNQAAGAAGLTLSDIPHPHAAENDVTVRVYAAGVTPGELDCKSLKRVQYRPGLIGGFLASTGLDLVSM